MHFTLKYRSGKSFGTGRGSVNYKASVKPTRDGGVSIGFRFQRPPQGKSDPAVSDATIRSLNLSLTKSEALRLAASIIAQAHHPLLHSIESNWMPPSAMPELPKSSWARGLKTSLQSWNKRLTIQNGTKAHLGKITFDVVYTTMNDDYSRDEHEIALSKIVDLPPTLDTSINIIEKDIPYRHRDKNFRLKSATPTRVTGMRPDDY